MNDLSAFLGRYEEAVREAFRSLDEKRFAERLWAKDASLWKSADGVQEKIKNRLGWLTVAETMAARADELTAFGRSIQEAGFRHALLLGMGGSSLATEVCRRTYGVAAGYPDLKILDSTDPATILHAEQAVDLSKTLFVVSSKSGTTIEVQSLYRYFSKKLKSVKRSAMGESFIAITDSGTPLEKLAREQEFRKIFINPSDVGGLYSALSYFGLVPMALIGQDLKVFLGRAQEMIQACRSGIPADRNPGVRLGAIIGELARQGRDKVTLLCSPAIRSFGVWVEQLLAESTGKEGRGLIPIAGEAIGDLSIYGNDRLFIRLTVSSAPDSESDRAVPLLKKAGHPVVQIALRDSLDLAGEFFRWEAATAAAGALLGVNPFDEPQVAESKQKTQEVLTVFQKTGRIEPPTKVSEEDGIGLYGDAALGRGGSLRDALEKFLNRVKPPDYAALLAFVEPSDVHESQLQALRRMIRDHYHVATLLGYGPRYLHSTGQLHKGGPERALFIQITAEGGEELPIPGERYSFGALIRAQALGDYYAMTRRGLRVIQIHLGKNVENDLGKLIEIFKAICHRTPEEIR